MNLSSLTAVALLIFTGHCALASSSDKIFSSGSDISSFERVFNDSTLRLDYSIAGNASSARVALTRMSKSEGWAGRRQNLAKAPYRGYGSVVVVDKESADTIYSHSFSTLFSEWRTTDEAREVERAFQNSFLVPLPKKEAVVTVSILDSYGHPIASLSHPYSPADILVRRITPSRTTPFKYIHQGGRPEEAIDVAILAEGYTLEEMDKFYSHAEEAAKAILAHRPFAGRSSDFNFIAVASPSLDSGVSVPKDDAWRKTAFGSHYSTFYSDRYLTTPEVYDVHDALEGIPYEHIIILANSPVYGGGGIYNSYTLTTTGNENFRPVVVHEFGHSFGGLADEYFYETDVMNDTYPADSEPWEPNITTLVDFSGKWGHLLDEAIPIPTPISEVNKYPLGVFEGAAYSFKGVYRPADDCRMRTNTCPDFCPACEDAINRLIDFYTGNTDAE